MFQPSPSWVSKAGVKLDYAPEDTARSILFTKSDYQPSSLVPGSDMVDSSRDVPDGAVCDNHEDPRLGARDSDNHAVIQQDENCRYFSKPDVSLAKKSTHTGRTIPKPAPFLRRRQGMAAWCSKIRRQGMPIRDPAEELRKKQTSSSDSTQAGDRDSIQPSAPAPQPSNFSTKTHAPTVVELPPTHSNLQSKKPFSALFRGCVDRSPTRIITQEPSGDARPMVQRDMGPKISSSDVVRTSNEEVQTDNGDLEEFELLEEIAENSSFSSLTTSFVSKLGKSALRDKLKMAEERLYRLTLMDRENPGGSEVTELQQQPFDKRITHSNSATNVSGILDDGPDALQSCVTDRSSASITRTASLNRLGGSILTTDGRSKSKKVARFHLAPEISSGCKGGLSVESTLHEPRPCIPASQPLPHLVSKDTDITAQESTDFDDNQSWIASPAESAARNVSQSMSQTDPPVTSTGIISQTLTNLSDCRPVVTAISGETRRLSPVAQLTRSSEPVDRSTELASLADQFMGTLDQDSASLGRSNSESHTLLRQWINRLEQEVKRFKTENNNLTKLKAEREDALRCLEREMKQFEQYKAKEQQSFNEYKQNEMRKLKKERRVLDEYQHALKSMTTKKDREEVERLRGELQEARSDLSRREVRWHSAIARLRTRISELESEREELKGRIHRLEADRVSLQAQLHDVRGLQVKSGAVRRVSSSTGSTRQTLNSVSQALTFKTVKQDRPSSTQATTIDRRQQQHRQYLSSCRLSSRASSRSGGLESLSDLGARHEGSLTGSRPGSVDRHSIDKTNRSDASQRPRSTASMDCARDSVHSGGYFTGDDDCASGGSDRAMSEFKASINNPGAPQIERIPSRQSVHDPSEPPVPVEEPNKSTQSLPLPGTAASGHVIHSLEHADGSVEKTYSNGAVVLNYTNGSIKEVFPDKKTIVVSLFNGDIKRTLPDGRVIYHYAVDGTVQITYPDGREEINYADGRKEIVYPKAMHTNSKTTEHSSGDIVSRILPNGDREICLPNGQREIHSVSGIKCRIYPDGTTKTVFPDGRHETHYASGRLRIKDAQGNLVLDTRVPLHDHLSQQSIALSLAPSG